MPQVRLRPVFTGIFAGSVLTLSLLAAVLSRAPIASAQQTPRTPVPLATLVPPTLVPPPPVTPTQPPTQSALAVIKSKGRISSNNRPTLIVGIPYNIKPFASLTT